MNCFWLFSLYVSALLINPLFCGPIKRIKNSKVISTEKHISQVVKKATKDLLKSLNCTGSNTEVSVASIVIPDQEAKRLSGDDDSYDSDDSGDYVDSNQHDFDHHYFDQGDHGLKIPDGAWVEEDDSDSDECETCIEISVDECGDSC